jgi:hypothetical protein
LRFSAASVTGRRSDVAKASLSGVLLSDNRTTAAIAPANDASPLLAGDHLRVEKGSRMAIEITEVHRCDAKPGTPGWGFSIIKLGSAPPRFARIAFGSQSEVEEARKKIEQATTTAIGVHVQG